MCLGSIKRFCLLVENSISSSKGLQIAMISRPDPKALSNAVFLIGSYMIMHLGLDVQEVASRFSPLHGQLATFRDISPGKQNFHLHVTDCWSGLWRAKSLRWVDFGLGGFDCDRYEHEANPLNGCVHEVVPGKFVVMRGPKLLPDGKDWWDIRDAQGLLVSREFSPAHYVSIVHDRGVRAVIRLSVPEYEDKAFTDRGIAVADLRFGVCVPPPADVVGKFLAIAEGVSGPVAVHCRAGLGRTGTMIGLYMMKHYGFSAREAMGWLRIVRPGRLDFFMPSISSTQSL